MKILKSTLWLLALISLFACPLNQLVGQETGEDAEAAEAAEADKKAEEEIAEDTVDSIAAEWQEKYGAYMKAIRDAAPEERPAIAATMPKINDYVDRMMVVAEADIASDDGKKALMWIIGNGRGVGRDEATNLMIEHHSDSPEMTTVIMGKTRENPSESSLTLFDNLVANSSSERVRGMALYARAMQLKQGYSVWARYSEMLAKAEGMTEEEVEAAYRGMGMDQLRRTVTQFQENIPAAVQEMYTDEATFNAEIEKAFVKVVDDFGDVKLSDADNSPTIGDRAESELFELRYLTVGRVAPEIEGEDVDGVTFKLSDYRGKVVVIDFWGDW